MEARTAFMKHEAESEDVSQDLATEISWKVKEERRSIDDDDLGESMMKLHSAQEALEREVQKLSNVAKDDPVFFNNSVYDFISTLNHGDIKIELEEIMKQKFKAEIEYIIISETIKNMKAEPLDRIELMVQQKNLAVEQVEVMNKLEGAEMKAMELKRQAEKLEVACEEILESEEVLMVQNRVSRLTSCFTVQLILFLLAIYLFVLRFSSNNLEVVLVPT